MGRNGGRRREGGRERSDGDRLIVGHVPTTVRLRCRVRKCRSSGSFAAPVINRCWTIIDRKLAGIIFHDEGSGLDAPAERCRRFRSPAVGSFRGFMRLGDEVSLPCFSSTFRFRLLVDSTNRRDLLWAYRWGNESRDN